jgi:hypothetical protein
MIEPAPDEAYIRQALDDGRATIQEISMKALGVIDTRFQARVKHLDMDHVERLELIIADGDRLAPVVIFRAQKEKSFRLILADGFHRHEVYRRNGSLTIRAIVIDVPWDQIEREARLFAAMCNRITLLSRTPQDVRKAVEILFAYPECWEWADNVIAKHCGTSPISVRKYRLEFLGKEGTKLPDKVKTSRGNRVCYQRPSKPEVPRITRNEKTGIHSISVKGETIHLGSDPSVATMKAGVIAEEKAKKYHLLNPRELVKFLRSRCLRFNHPMVVNTKFPGISGLHGHGVVLVTSKFDSPDSVPYDVGCVQMLREIVGEPDARMVIVCYPEDGPKASIEIARKLVIEFLTPDDLVASFKPSDER